MPSLHRRHCLAGFAAALAPTAAFAQAKKLKLLLNTSFSGPVAFFLLAEDRSYLREAGFEIAFSPGGGAAVIVPQVKSPDFDIGYGDITALIERIARGAPNEGPVAIYTTFNTVPFTIAVAANGPVKMPRDF
jgi:NitT/TauT family transport system substrate-binding protein